MIGKILFGIMIGSFITVMLIDTKLEQEDVYNKCILEQGMTNPAVDIYCHAVAESKRYERERHNKLNKSK